MKIIFLDRDGVINKDPGGFTEHSYVTRCEEFSFLAGSKEAVKRLTVAGYEIIIISNQAGVNKGYFSLRDLDKIDRKMLDGLGEAGGHVRPTYYCPHRKEERCGCRKPDTGLFDKALAGRKIDFSNTYFIGDGATDVEAGKKIGCKTILLLSGKSKLSDVEGWSHKPDYIKNDLLDAVDLVLKSRG